MSIAGFDPSGGAGLLADIKTFEQHGVYGLGVITANTLQTEDRFYSVHWIELKEVLKAIDVLLTSYPVSAVKTGIVPSFDYFFEIIKHIKKLQPEIKIVVDPIIQSTTGFDFMINPQGFKNFAGLVHLITPNISEAMLLTNNNNEQAAAEELSVYCNVFVERRA